MTDAEALWIAVEAVEAAMKEAQGNREMAHQILARRRESDPQLRQAQQLSGFLFDQAARDVKH